MENNQTKNSRSKSYVDMIRKMIVFGIGTVLVNLFSHVGITAFKNDEIESYYIIDLQKPED